MAATGVSQDFCSNFPRQVLEHCKERRGADAKIFRRNNSPRTGQNLNWVASNCGTNSGKIGPSWDFLIPLPDLAVAAPEVIAQVYSPFTNNAADFSVNTLQD